MAGENTTTATTLTETVYASIITDRVLQELRPYNVSRPLFRWGAAGPSKVYDFPIWDDEGAASGSVVEADDFTTSTAVDTTRAQVTAGEIAMMTQVADFAVKISIIDVLPEVAGMLARGLAEKFETDAAALYDDFSNVTTAAGALTPADFLDAMSALEQRDVVGSLVSVLHPQQAGELRSELAASGASIFVNGGTGMVGPNLEGSVGSLFGVPIFQTSLVVATGGLHGGAIFVRGEALGAYEVWGPRIELQRDASARATQIVATQCYGVGEISDTRGQGIDSLD